MATHGVGVGGGRHLQLLRGPPPAGDAGGLSRRLFREWGVSFRGSMFWGKPGASF